MDHNAKSDKNIDYSVYCVRIEIKMKAHNSI